MLEKPPRPTLNAARGKGKMVRHGKSVGGAWQDIDLQAGKEESKVAPTGDADNPLEGGLLRGVSSISSAGG